FVLADHFCIRVRAGIPYSGADAYTKMVSQNKQLQKAFFDKLNLPTPSWSYIHSKEEISACKFPKHPVIVKPAYEGSSIGIYPGSLSRNCKETRLKAAGLFKSHKMPLLIENFIAGKEYKVGIIGSLPGVFIAMIEDTLADGTPLGKEFIHLSAKKDITFSKKPADINRKEFKALRDDCLKIYRLLGPMDYATFDIRMDKSGRHYFLEVNADATLHPLRTLAKCCALHNMDFDSMIQFILNSSLKRQGLQ
ncbi:MAG TPA: D-alanine--D-alanine ligase, partial [Candidatus Goldiibacteriota bacterium]|nr:D-alanine--D-alanine ligase [Candidatus Goldiibacteriota bacterium]